MIQKLNWIELFFLDLMVDNILLYLKIHCLSLVFVSAFSNTDPMTNFDVGEYLSICYEIKELFWPLIRKFNFFSTFLSLDRKRIMSVLSTFNDTLLARRWCTTSFRSWFMCLLIHFNEELEYRWFLSSAKWCIDECFVKLLRLLI